MAGVVDQDRQRRALASVQADHSHRRVHRFGCQLRHVGPEHLRLPVQQHAPAIMAQVRHSPPRADAHRCHHPRRHLDRLLDAADCSAVRIRIRRVDRAGVRVRRAKDDLIHAVRAHRLADLVHLRQFDRPYQVQRHQGDRTAAVCQRQDARLRRIEDSLRHACARAVTSHGHAQRRFEIHLRNPGLQAVLRLRAEYR